MNLNSNLTGCKGVFLVKRYACLFLVAVLLIFAGTLMAKTEIEFWHAMGGDRIELIQSWADEFMKDNPDVVVKTQYAGSYDDIWTKLTASLKTGKAPNIIQLDSSLISVVVDGEVVVPVQNFIDKYNDFNPDVLLDTVRDTYTLNGRLYSMPFNSSTPVLYYNKTIFKEMGLDPTKPPTTLDEVLEVSRKLVKKDAQGNIERAAITWPFAPWFFSEWMSTANESIVDNDNGRSGRPTTSTFYTDTAVKVLDWWKQLTDEDLIINTTVNDWLAARTLFMSQKVAMMVSTSADGSFQAAAARANGYEIGIAFLPAADASKMGGVSIGGASLWMIDGHKSAQDEASWKFMKYLASKDIQVEWHKRTGYIPVRKDSCLELLYSGYYQEYPEMLTALVQLMFSKVSPATAGPVVGVFPQIRMTLVKQIEKVLNGQDTSAHALQESDKECAKAIAEYNEMFR